MIGTLPQLIARQREFIAVLSTTRRKRCKRSNTSLSWIGGAFGLGSSGVYRAAHGGRLRSPLSLAAAKLMMLAGK